MVWPMAVLLSTEVQKSLELIVGPDEVKVVTSSREQGFMVMYLFRVYKVKNNWSGVITWIDS